MIDLPVWQNSPPPNHWLGSTNKQGEQQKKLDVITNDVLKNALRFTGRLSVLASEEEDHPVSLESYEEMYKEQRRADVVVEEGSKVRRAWGVV